MTGVEMQSDDYDLPCSDEELTQHGCYIGKSWVVEANELEKLYNFIDKNKLLPLEWKCSGRRAPTPIPVSEEIKPAVLVSPVKEENSNFDFKDEVTSLTFFKLRKRREGALRGSAKKQTTSFDSILSNLIRQKCMEEQTNIPSASSVNVPRPDESGI